MYTKQALRALGVSDTDFTAEQARALSDVGYFVVENVLSPAECRQMADAFEQIHAAEQLQGGHEVHVEPGARRISNIFNKSDAFDRCLKLPPVLAAAHHLLGEIKVHGANLRDPVKDFGQQQIHVDCPKLFEDDWWVLNAMVLFDDMTLQNGPTRVVPGSHKWAPFNVPYVNQSDWEPPSPSAEDRARIPKDPDAPYPGEIFLTAPAGAVAILNSSMWHSGTMKFDDSHRRLLHLTYTRRDLPQQLVQLDYLTPALYGRMNAEHRFLLEIEPPRSGDAILRQPKRQHQGWWN